MLPATGFSIKPLKVKLLAGEQKATKYIYIYMYIYIYIHIFVGRRNVTQSLSFFVPQMWAKDGLVLKGNVRTKRSHFQGLP